jgi:GGDEF domain-containing protein
MAARSSSSSCPGRAFTRHGRAEAIRLAVQNITVSLRGQLIGPLTMSFGVSVASELADTAEALVANADRALVDRQQYGRKRVASQN